jgi:hypothetical protein
METVDIYAMDQDSTTYDINFKNVDKNQKEDNI